MKNQELLDPAFVAQQRIKLTKLLGELSGAVETARAEQVQMGADRAAEAHEKEEDAQRLASLDVGVGMIAQDNERLARVRRALTKIDEGTYGFSDASGVAIPKARLEAMPDAIYTVAEQEKREPSPQPSPLHRIA